MIIRVISLRITLMTSSGLFLLTVELSLQSSSSRATDDIIKLFSQAESFLTCKISGVQLYSLYNSLSTSVSWPVSLLFSNNAAFRALNHQLSEHNTTITDKDDGPNHENKTQFVINCSYS